MTQSGGVACKAKDVFEEVKDSNSGRESKKIDSRQRSGVASELYSLVFNSSSHTHCSTHLPWRTSLERPIFVGFQGGL